MAHNQSERPAVQIVQALLEAIFRAVEHDEEVMRELYEEAGINRDQAISDIVKRLRSTKLGQRKLLAQKKRVAILEMLSNLKGQRIVVDKATLLAKLREILGPEASSPAFAAFHKLERLDEEDIRNMLEELDAARYLDEQEEDQEPE